MKDELSLDVLFDFNEEDFKAREELFELMGGSHAYRLVADYFNASMKMTSVGHNMFLAAFYSAVDAELTKQQLTAIMWVASAAMNLYWNSGRSPSACVTSVCMQTAGKDIAVALLSGESIVADEGLLLMEEFINSVNPLKTVLPNDLKKRESGSAVKHATEAERREYDELIKKHGLN